jgi:sporulation protein YlmC with PRC-barrel domain
LLPVYLYAQNVAPSATPQKTAEGSQNQPASGQATISLRSLVNSKVLDRDNKEMGTVKDLMLDLGSGKLVRADIALGNGGFLGITSGEQRISVPWEQLSVKRHDGGLVVVMNQEVVEKIRTERTTQTAERNDKQQEKQSSAAKSGATPTPQPSSVQSKQQATVNQQVRASTDEIKKAEEALQAKGLNPGPVDGKIDSRTQAALREFQKQNNLAVTGSLDEQTAEKLGIKLGGASGSSEQPGKEPAAPESKSYSPQTK